ncbi:hypothetical protein Efla_004255 [Eimeria flavescens]
MQPAAACRFSRAGALQFVKGTRFFASSQVTPVQRNASPQAVQPSAMAAPSAEPLASSFIQPLPIPGIRRAPRTPTLPSDSKFVKYGAGRVAVQLRVDCCFLFLIVCGNNRRPAFSVRADCDVPSSSGFMRQVPLRLLVNSEENKATSPHAAAGSTLQRPPAARDPAGPLKPFPRRLCPAVCFLSNLFAATSSRMRAFSVFYTIMDGVLAAGGQLLRNRAEAAGVRLLGTRQRPWWPPPFAASPAFLGHVGGLLVFAGS